MKQDFDIRAVRFFAATLIILFSLPYRAQAQTTDSFSPDVPYQEAVPAFLNAVTRAVEDVENKDDIARWADDTKSRLPEFLDDLIGVSSDFSHQPLGQFDSHTLDAFLSKWQTVITDCPECQALAPLVEPLVTTLFEDIPRLRRTRAGDVPFQNLSELFGQLRNMNPWGMGPLFQIEPPPSGVAALKVAELSREQVQEGIKEIFVIRRRTLQIINNQIAFEEWIDDDAVRFTSFLFQAHTMIHETLTQLQENGGDPEVIAMLEDLVALINEDLQLSYEAGLLDEFSYSLFFNTGPIRNELIHVVHPLMKDPYNKIYKTVPFYPRTFSGSPLDAFSLTSASSPASTPSSNLRIIRPAPEIIPTPQDISAALDQDLAASAGTAHRVFNLWTLGVILPGIFYFLSSVIKGGLPG